MTATIFEYILFAEFAVYKDVLGELGSMITGGAGGTQCEPASRVKHTIVSAGLLGFRNHR